MQRGASVSSWSWAEAGAWTKGRAAHDPRAFPVYGIAVILAGFVTFAVVFLGYGYDADFVVRNASALWLYIAIGLGARWLGFARIGGLIEAWMLLLMVSALAALAAFIAAGLNLPAVDQQLARADLMLFGFSRDGLPQLAAAWPATFRLITAVYNTLVQQPFILLAALLFLGDADRAWKFLLGWSLALVLCLSISPFTPAYGTPPYVLDWIDVFDGARDGTLRRLDSSVLTGIVTFPSFHAAGAVVLAWGFAGIRFVRVPMIALNAFVVLSAVLVGGHYLVDIAAGLCVGAAAIVAAEALCRRTFVQQVSLPPAGVPTGP